MINVLDGEANIRADRGRVPKEEHWGQYHKADQKIPGLIQALRGEIDSAASAQAVAHENKGVGLRPALLLCGRGLLRKITHLGRSRALRDHP